MGVEIGTAFWLETTFLLTHHRDFLYKITEQDAAIYERVLPGESKLLDAAEEIDWAGFEAKLEEFYDPKMGQPAYPPLVLFKIELLRYFYNLSDRQVIDRCWTDLLFRYFLGIGIQAKLPDPSNLTRFRGRLGADGFGQLFDELIRQARGLGLVRDRLRLKDASHVLAAVAVPNTLTLLAQLRERMLSAIEAIDPEIAEGFRVDLRFLRESTERADDETRLQERLNLVTSILDWMNSKRPDEEQGAKSAAWQRFQSVKALAEKIVGDRANLGAGDRTISVVDPDARCGKHGEFYDGFLLDVMMDADSELITALEVLPANGEEAADAIALIKQEEQTHGNDIEQLSIDGIGFNGAVLRELEAAEGLCVDVITPTHDFNATEGFPSSAFELVEDGTRVRCPAGELSGIGSRKPDRPNTTFFQFRGSLCASCPLLAQCHPTKKTGSRTGRRVSKNEYEYEYERARAKTKTVQYEAVRKEHPAIERKLNELVRHHRGRQARYWGRMKVKIQQLMTAFAVNIKRISVLLKGRAISLPA